MKTFTVLVNIYDDDFIDTFQGTMDVKASSKEEAIQIAEKNESVSYVSDCWEKE